MSVVQLGKEIASLRKARGCKQEELANAIGVSTQAVSKWENGGMPDIELLPGIADFFGVSIDRLFQRSVTDYRDINEALMKKINDTPHEERIKLIFSYCFDMERAYMSKKALEDGVENYEKGIGKNEQIYSSIRDDRGFTLAGIANRSQYFLVVPDAADADAAYFNGIDYTEFFKDFSDKTVFDACVFFHKRASGNSRKTFTPALLVQNLGITEEKAAAVIDTLVKYHMLQSTQLELNDEVQTVYTFAPTPSFVALLIFARELIEVPSRYSYYCGCRDKPYLK